MTTRVVINADDYGLSLGICDSIDLLMRSGAISSTTMMIAAPRALITCEKRDLSALKGRCGVHLQVTSGKPLSEQEKVPSLVDQKTGHFKEPSQFDEMDLSQVETEWRAQFEAVRSLLRERPTHLDSHHGAHHDPRLGTVFFSLADEYDLPVRDAPVARQIAPERDIRGSEILLYEWTAKGLSGDRLIESLNAARGEHSPGLVEVVTHPGFNSSYLEEISGLNAAREIEHHELLSLSERNALDLNGFELVSFGDI